jgi:hypothetical protein
MGVKEVPALWYREAHPIGIPGQLLIGLLAGLALAAVARTRARSFIVDKAKWLHGAAGSSLTYAVGLGALCLTSVSMIFAHVWLGPTVFLSAALVALLDNRRWFTSQLRNGAARLRWRWVVACLAIAIPVAAAIVESALDAYPADVANVRSILDDPSAVHVSAPKPKAAGEANMLDRQMQGEPVRGGTWS